VAEVTERDFRMPQFRDAKVEDYEFRDDGKVVRKDRWEMGLRRIAGRVALTRDFEIDAVVYRVSQLIDAIAFPEGDDSLDVQP
jgi:hypothetical protein